MALQTAVAAGVVSQVLVPAFRSALLSRAVASCLNAAARLSPVSNPLNDAAGPNVLEQGEVRRVLTELDIEATVSVIDKLVKDPLVATGSEGGNNDNNSSSQEVYSAATLDAAEHLAQTLNDLTNGLLALQGKIFDDQQRWFKNLRASSYVDELELLKTLMVVLKGRLELFMKTLQVHALTPQAPAHAAHARAQRQQPPPNLSASLVDDYDTALVGSIDVPALGQGEDVPVTESQIFTTM